MQPDRTKDFPLMDPAPLKAQQRRVPPRRQLLQLVVFQVGIRDRSGLHDQVAPHAAIGQGPFGNRIDIGNDPWVIASQRGGVSEELCIQSDRLPLLELQLQGEKPDRDEAVLGRDPLGKRMGDPVLDNTDMNPVPDAVDPSLHQQSPDAAAPRLGVNGQPAELRDKVTPGADIQDD